jgi:rhomboid protease GluP
MDYPRAMRQATGSMICPGCGKLIGVSEEKCPFCGAWNPSFYGYAPALQKLVGQRIDLIQVIVAACIGLYVAALVIQPEAIFHFSFPFGILQPGQRALYQLGMTSRLTWDQGWWWTVFTAIYLHGGILHILFNVLWIRDLAPEVTRVYGPARAFIVFSVAGAAGFVLSDLMSGAPTVGASGSIFGLLAALIVYGRRSGESHVTGRYMQFAIVMFAFGFFMSSVNNWAHAGGFAGGWIVATLLRDTSRRESAYEILIALGLLGVTLVGFVLSFINVTGILLRR